MSEDGRKGSRWAYERALLLQLTTDRCSDSVLEAVRQALGMDPVRGPSSVPICCADRHAQCGSRTCGALAAGLQALEQVSDRAGTVPWPLQDEAHGLLRRRFAHHFGGTTCAEVQRHIAGQLYDLRDDRQWETFRKARGNLCALATAEVARWVVAEAGRYLEPGTGTEEDAGAPLRL